MYIYIYISTFYGVWVIYISVVARGPHPAETTFGQVREIVCYWLQ
jgi:hypothetical protein